MMLLSNYTLENQCKTKLIFWLLEKTPRTPSPLHSPSRLSKHTIVDQKQPLCEWNSYLCQDVIIEGEFQRHFVLLPPTSALPPTQGNAVFMYARRVGARGVSGC